MKIIFLDIDGVLNSHEHFATRGKKRPRDDMFVRSVSKKNVGWLQKIVDATDARIVISSTWRLLHSLPDLRNGLRRRGLRAKILGKTCELRHLGKERGHEIAAWLEAHPNVESFVILDDDGDMAHLKSRLVQTRFERGLIRDHVDLAIAMLATSRDGSGR